METKKGGSTYPTLLFFMRGIPQAALFSTCGLANLLLKSSMASLMISEILFWVVIMISWRVSRSSSLILIEMTLYRGCSLILPISISSPKVRKILFLHMALCTCYIHANVSTGWLSGEKNASNRGLNGSQSALSRVPPKRMYHLWHKYVQNCTKLIFPFRIKKHPSD